MRSFFLIVFPFFLFLFSCAPNSLTNFGSKRQSAQSPFYPKIAGIYNLAPDLKDSVLLLQIFEDGKVFWWHERPQKIVECQIGAWALQDSVLSLLHGQNMFPEFNGDSFGISAFGVNGSIQDWIIVNVDSLGITAKVALKPDFFLKRENRPQDSLERKYIDLLSDYKFQKRLAKRRKQQERRFAASLRHQFVKRLIEQRQFILGADFIITHAGERFTTNGTLNFVSVDSAKGCVQVGSPVGLGLNGVGGFTLDGAITRYEIKEINSNSSHRIAIEIMTRFAGLLIVTMSVDGNGNAGAVVTGGTFRGHFRFEGKLLPFSNTAVFYGNGP